MTKGSQFYMQINDLHVETYEKRDGGQGVKLAGRVAEVEFTRGQRQSSEAPPAAPAPPPKPAKGGSGFDDMDDSIPF
jgi:single-strand DNA-binding protein